MKMFFEEINKVDIFLAQLIRKKRHQLLVLGMRGGHHSGFYMY